MSRGARVRPERRAHDRPVDGDQRPCPVCRVGAFTFHERVSIDGQQVPAWRCESPACGYRTVVRPAPGAEVLSPKFAVIARHREVIRKATRTSARARRTAMKSRARGERSKIIIAEAKERCRERKSIVLSTRALRGDDELMALRAGAQVLREAAARLHDEVLSHQREIDNELKQCVREIEQCRMASDDLLRLIQSSPDERNKP